MNPGPGDDPGVALLAARMARLADRLATAETTLGEHDAAIGQAAGLADQVTRLSRLLTARPGGGGEEPADRVYPRILARMSEDDYTEALRELARWVTQILLVTYPHVAAELPPCWPAHRAVVAELDWLCWAWEDIWAGQAPPRASDAAWWHDRWLPGVLARIDPLLTTCKTSHQHVDPGDRRPQHAGYSGPPPGTAPEDYWPELEFIEHMRDTALSVAPPAATSPVATALLSTPLGEGHTPP